jgi:hypothetical protein
MSTWTWVGALNPLHACVTYGGVVAIALALSWVFDPAGSEPFSNMFHCERPCAGPVSRELPASAVLSIVVIVVCTIGACYLLLAPAPPLPEEHAKLVEAPSAASLEETAPSKPRLHFLDSVKTILTATVVLHHATETFFSGGLTLNIAHYLNSFQVFGATFIVLNQSYFMVGMQSGARRVLARADASKAARADAGAFLFYIGLFRPVFIRP